MNLDWVLFWNVVGVAAAIVFYGRFYLQWIVSERAQQSVMPVAFWYMSSIGSLMLFAYGVYSRSPVGVLAHTFNIAVYSRNLVHIWRENDKLTPARSTMAHGLVGAILLVAAALLAYTWFREFEATRQGTSREIALTWIWIAVGVIGQGLFAARFAVQWAATELKQKSVIPTAFWYFSLAAAILMTASFTQRAAYVNWKEWIYALGTASTIPIYARNLWFIYRGKKVDTES